MSLYVIQYQYPTDLKMLVEDFRPAHRNYMRQLQADGHLLAAGFLGDAVYDGGMMLVRAESAQAALKLLEGDPFYANDLMDDLQVLAWTPTLGAEAPGFDTEFPVS